MPTRFAKQLVQLGRGALVLGMTREEAMAVVARCAATRCRRCAAGARRRRRPRRVRHRRRGDSGCSCPWTTVDRTLQELHLLELLVVTDQKWGESVRWAYSLAADVSTTALKKLTGNVTTVSQQSAEG